MECLSSVLCSVCQYGLNGCMLLLSQSARLRLLLRLYSTSLDWITSSLLFAVVVLTKLGCCKPCVGALTCLSQVIESVKSCEQLIREFFDLFDAIIQQDYESGIFGFL